MHSPSTLEQETYQEYGTAKGWRIAMYVLSPILIVLFLTLPFLLWNGQQIGATVGISIVAIMMAALFAAGLIETIRARHIITNEALLYKGAFYQKCLPLASIQGYRIDQQYLRLFPASPDFPKIRIGYTSEHYEELKSWFAARYPDLDAVEQQEEQATILQDHDLGRTAEEREEKLAQAQKTAKVLNFGGVGAALWLIMQPQPYTWATTAGLLLPLLGAVAVWLHRGVLRPDEKKNSAYPSATSILLLPSLGLSLRALLDFEILDYSLLWPRVAIVAASLGSFLLLSASNFVFKGDSRLSATFSILLYAAVYGFGATTTYNCVSDTASPTIYKAKVLTKHYSSGKTTTYYLTVSPWGPRHEAEDVTVSEDYYNQAMPGSTVAIVCKPGRLLVPWFTVAE